jgi:hypothetical protein
VDHSLRPGWEKKAHKPLSANKSWTLVPAPVIPAKREAVQRRTYLKNNKAKRTWSLAQVVQHLPAKRSSNPSSAATKKERLATMSFPGKSNL